MADDSSPVLPSKGTMLYIERRLKEFKMQLGPMKRGPKKWPRKGGKGGSASLTTNFAVTTSALAAGSVTGSGASFQFTPGVKGTAYLLEWVYSGSVWKLDVPENPEEIEVVSGYKDCEIPSNSFVLIDFSGTLAPGYDITSEDNPPVATFVEVMDYLRTANNYTGEGIEIFYANDDALTAGSEECESA